VRLRNILIIVFVVLVLGGILIVIFRGGKHDENGEPSVYLIGRDPSWYQTEFLGKGREALAFVDELLTEIAREQQLNIRLVRITSDAIFPSLVNGKVNAVVTARELPHYFNQDRYVQSELFYELGPVLIVRRGYPAEELKDLKGKVVGVERGSPLTYALRSDPDVIFVTYANILTALERLEEASIDAVVLPFLPAAIYVNSLFRNDLHIVSAPLLEDGVRVVAPKNVWNPALIESINKGLDTLKEDGRYQALLSRWNLPAPIHSGAEQDVDE